MVDQGRGARTASPYPNSPTDPYVRLSRLRLTDGLLNMVALPPDIEPNGTCTRCPGPASRTQHASHLAPRLVPGTPRLKMWDRHGVEAGIPTTKPNVILSRPNGRGDHGPFTYLDGVLSRTDPDAAASYLGPLSAACRLSNQVEVDAGTRRRFIKDMVLLELIACGIKGCPIDQNGILLQIAHHPRE